MQQRHKQLLGIGLLIAAAGLLVWGFWPGRQAAPGMSVEPVEPEFHGFVLEPKQPAPELALSDQHGQPFRLADHRGNVIVLFFGYTNCPDVCPTTLARYSLTKRELGDKADRVKFAFITVDPEYDTPEHLGQYVARFDPEFYGLSGNQEQTAAVVSDYGIYVEFVEDVNAPAGYWVNHTALSYVIDRDGNMRLAHPFGVEPQDVATDLLQLL